MTIWRVLCAVCLAPLIASCAGQPTTRVEYRLVTPPAHLMASTPVPAWAGGDWAAVADLAESRKAALQQCNADKASILDYVRHAQALYDPDAE